MRDAPFAVGVLRALIKRKAVKLVAGPPSPSLSLVVKPAKEPASSTDGFRKGLEMLEREMGLRKEGFAIKKLLGGAAPRIDLRCLGAKAGGDDTLLPFETVLDGAGGGTPVCVELEKLELIESCDSLRWRGRETRLAVEPMC